MFKSYVSLLTVVAITFTLSSIALAQRKPNPAFVDPKVDENLPNVLLIGDSISIGYMLDARKALAGKANVFRPKTNCGPTTRGLEQLESWIGSRKWDVIHFNFGLHDLKYMGANGKNLADPDSADSHQQVPAKQYAANIKSIASRLKQTGAIVIWRETTPVPEGAAGRVPGDSAKYNQIAAEVIEQLGGIQTDPMFRYAENIAAHQRPKNVHYTPEGSRLLGVHVADVIEKALKNR